MNVKADNIKMNISSVEDIEKVHRGLNASISIFDTMQGILLMLDKEGKISYFNKYMQQISGYRLEEVRGKDWFDTFLPEEDRGWTKELFKKAIGDTQTAGNINPIITKNEQEREIEWHDKTLKDAKGNIIGLVAIGQDITERRKVETQMRQRKEDLELINRLNEITNRGGSLQDAIEALSEETKKMFASYGATVYLLSDDGKYMVGQNLQLPEKTSRVIEKTIGMKIPEIKIKLEEKGLYSGILNSGKPRIINEPELISKSIAEFTDSEVLKRLAPKIKNILGISSTMVAPLIFNDKAIGQVDISSSKIFNKDDLKRFATIAVHISSIINRKQTEEKLKQSENSYRNNIESFPDGIVTLNTDGFVESANPAFLELTGFSKEEILGKHISKMPLFCPQDIQKYQHFLKEVLKGKKVKTFEIKWAHRDGTHRLGEIHSGAIKRDNQITGVQIIARDITECRQENEQYKAIVQNTPVGFWLNDTSGNIIDVNDIYCRMTGYTRQELLKMSIKDIEIVEKPYEIVRHIEDIAKSGYDIFETKHRCKDGTIINVEISASRIDLGEARNLVFIRDINERKQVQAALYESEEKYRSLVKNVRMGVFRSTPGPIGRFLEVNPAMQEITGYSREELLSMDVCNLFLNPQERAMVLDKLSKVTDTITMELKMKKKDGSQMVVSDTKAPVRDDKGRVLYFDGILEDITERKRAEDELKESEERYRALFESTYDIVQSIAADGSFIFVNPAWFKTLGYTKDELTGLKLFDIIHPKSKKHCREVFNRIMNGETLSNIQSTFVAKNGREIQVEGNIIPRIIGGRVIASQGFYRDVTERKIMEEQLIVTDRLASIGELASGIAHELNNPLTGVIGFSELLLEKNVPNETREDIAIIHHEAVRASEVVKNLLTFAHRHSPSKQPVNINSTIASVLGLRAYEQKVRNIEVITDFAADLPDVIADGFQLQQVFLNIIVNASYAMEEANNKGILKIRTEWMDNSVRAIFMDDGPGISKENMNHIFDPFFTTKEIGRGTGLGLSICHGIVTEHKGKISVVSEPGKGATFLVELPVGKKEKEES